MIEKKQIWILLCVKSSWNYSRKRDSQVALLIHGLYRSCEIGDMYSVPPDYDKSHCVHKIGTLKLITNSKNLKVKVLFQY